MSDIKIIIGANAGDEGKGLFTDYFSSFWGKDCTVVRFNGGAQAGHTVVTPEGKRHVFSHFGSGYFNNSKSYLSYKFIVNPLLFYKEHQSFPEYSNIIYKYCRITTPWDMIIGQIFEDNRTNKHGSCGVGINETVLRNNLIPFTVKDFLTSSYITKIDGIKKDWIKFRIGKREVSDKQRLLLESKSVEESFIDRMFYLIKNSIILDEVPYSKYYVFEGAQGLWLSQNNHKFWPHLTRSNTGIVNSLHIINSIPGNHNIEVIFVTRAYFTRHGEGPLSGECSIPYPSISDNTNIPNPYQGTMRFGILDLDVINKEISSDIDSKRKWPNLNINISLGITCLDQVGETIKYRMKGVYYEHSIDRFINNTKFYLSNLNMKNVYTSNGNSRNDVSVTQA